MGLGCPLGENGLEQHVTDPFADPLVAGQLFQQGVVILAYLGADRPGTNPRHRAGLPYVVVTSWEARSALERQDPAKPLKTNGAL